MSLFVVIKFLHVLLAIIAVGFNATYGVWLARVAKERVPTQSFVLRGIKRLDDWFANPAYVLLAVTGVTMVFVGQLDFRTFWISHWGSSYTRPHCGIRSRRSRAPVPKVRHTFDTPQTPAFWGSSSR